MTTLPTKVHPDAARSNGDHVETARVIRRLAAIVALDVVGFGRLIGLDEAGTRARLRATRRELIDPAIAAFGGRIVETAGGGLLLEFPSTVDVVRSAIEVQHGMAERNGGLSADQRIENIAEPLRRYRFDRAAAEMHDTTTSNVAAWTHWGQGPFHDRQGVAADNDERARSHCDPTGKRHSPSIPARQSWTACSASFTTPMPASAGGATGNARRGRARPSPSPAMPWRPRACPRRPSAWASGR